MVIALHPGSRVLSRRLAGWQRRLPFYFYHTPELSGARWVIEMARRRCRSRAQPARQDCDGVDHSASNDFSRPARCWLAWSNAAARLRTPLICLETAEIGADRNLVRVVGSDDQVRFRPLLLRALVRAAQT